METDASTNKPGRDRPAMVAAAVSIGLAVLKFVGWSITCSSALLAAAMDSATDVIVSLLSAWSVRAADAPPDEDHPYGHGKLEHMAALGQSLLLIGSAIGVLSAVIQRGGESPPLVAPEIGIGIAIVGVVVPTILARYLQREGLKNDSPATEADGAHYASDYWVNGGVIVAFASDLWFGWKMADPIVAVIISAAILRMAWQTGATALRGLMDEQIESDLIRIIDGIVRSRHPKVHGYHDLLTRRAGPIRFVQFHMEIDAELGFREAHRLVESVSADISRAIPNAQVTVHADPWPLEPDDLEAPKVRAVE